MAIRHKQKEHRRNNIVYTLIAAALICAVFISMMSFFYEKAEDDAYEMLHLQTKQIKDDLTLQIKSDRENLVTMAHFAEKLYADGESYDRMFASFEPIGLLSNIGILKPDNIFVTKLGAVDLNGKISFEEEAARGEYISGRIPDLTKDGREIIRSAVPIVSEGRTVGILYGVIRLEVINSRYTQMAKELDAQLFVYDKENGNFIIDSIHRNLGNISSLRDREYKDGDSYEAMVGSDKGYSSFKSIYRDENLYAHYSGLEDINWGIMLARYESQVFAKTHGIAKFMSILFSLMVLIVVIYLFIVLKEERRESLITGRASEIRKLLLEMNRQKENITKSLKSVMEISRSRSAIYVDIKDEDYNFMNVRFEKHVLMGEDRKYFVSEIFRYAAEFKDAGRADVGVMSVKADAYLAKTNHRLYDFFIKHDIKLVTFAAVTRGNDNNISVLGVINPKNKYSSRKLLQEIAVCFSIAVYNKNHLNMTYTAATTDSLTNVANRVAYKKDLIAFDEQRPCKFTCIYIDVNELHIRNNKYGHAAGDEMLIYIANALKSAFFGQKVYRMGGDEFLVFAKNTEQETIKRSLDVFAAQLKSVDYHVAIGVSYREQNTNTEEMVQEAEKRMYEAKAQYYQNKEQTSTSKSEDENYIQTKTGILEIDTMISVLKDHYNGIYRVSLESDTAHRILMPSYLGYNEDEKNFSRLLAKYIDETVHPDFHRAVMSFLNYDAIKKHLAENKTPKITYKKVNGETVILSVYNLGESKENVRETLWVFAKD